ERTRARSDSCGRVTGLFSIDAASSPTMVQRWPSVKICVRVSTMSCASVRDGRPLPRLRRPLQRRQNSLHLEAVAEIGMELGVGGERLEKLAQRGNERVLV